MRHDGFVFAAPNPGEALINMTHFETPLDALAMSRVTLDGRAQADTVLRFLRAEFPAAFGRARVRQYGLPGMTAGNLAARRSPQPPRTRRKAPS